jgi:peroxiredoxin
MKLISSVLLALGLLLFSNSDQLQIGDKAPQQSIAMASTSGNMVTLNGLKGKNGLCVIYSCNTCPWVIAWEDRYNEIYKQCNDAGIGFVLVNSNEAKREGADSMEEMKKHAKEKGYADFAYVVDENHVLADAFGATKTPDVFLFNGDMALVYKGAIDDNSKNKDGVEEAYLINAIQALSEGKEINPSSTKALGCSIKRIKS